MERPAGRYVVALACDGRVRVMAAVLHGPADELRERHELQPTSARLAAEALVASTLLASHIKGDERLTVELRSEQPAFAFMADIEAVGTLRARFTPTRTTMQRRFNGAMSVMKSLGPKVLYRGVADFRTESFEGALHRYLTTSQQVDARVRIGADVAADGMVTFASGLVVERMPGMGAEEFAGLFDRALENDFRQLMTQFAFGQLAGAPVEVLGAQDFVYRCTCSRERVLGMLRGLGPPEIEGMLRDQGGAEITCHFCNQRWEVSAAELRSLLAELTEQ